MGIKRKREESTKYEIMAGGVGVGLGEEREREREVEGAKKKDGSSE